jgi:hypothetical protein
MLIKHKDDVQPALDVLEGFLALKSLTRQQRELIGDEIANIRAGARGEKEAAYHIDFKLKDAKNWAVIHDLRLEHDGRVAQIDHLLIGRMFDLFVIESKNLKTAVRVKVDGEFEVKTRRGWQGMASPVEQNRRHIRVLDGLISAEKLTPARLGFQIRPHFRNWVLLAPECSLTRGETDDATILKMDMFDKGLEKHINHTPFGETFSLAKVCSTDTIAGFAEKLVSFHQPIIFDYAAKFGITPAQRYSSIPPVEIKAAKVSAVATLTCAECRQAVEPKVVNFCHANERRFGGAILCRICQTTASAIKPAAAPLVEVSGPTCRECNTPVDAKVVAFCRFNSRRFNKRVLCRTCQTNAAVPVG